MSVIRWKNGMECFRGPHIFEYDFFIWVSGPLNNNYVKPNGAATNGGMNGHAKPMTNKK